MNHSKQEGINQSVYEESVCTNCGLKQKRSFFFFLSVKVLFCYFSLHTNVNEVLCISDDTLSISLWYLK